MGTWRSTKACLTPKSPPLVDVLGKDVLNPTISGPAHNWKVLPLRHVLCHEQNKCCKVLQEKSLKFSGRIGATKPPLIFALYGQFSTGAPFRVEFSSPLNPG